MPEQHGASRLDSKQRHNRENSKFQINAQRTAHVDEYSTIRSSNMTEEERMIVEELKAFADALKTDKSLMELYLTRSGNRVSLPDALAMNDTHSKLKLSIDRICGEEEISLTNALTVDSTLRKLNLHLTFITDEGVKSLCRRLHEEQNTAGVDFVVRFHWRRGTKSIRKCLEDKRQPNVLVFDGK